MNKLLKDKSKLIILGGIFILLVVVIIVLSIIFNNNSDKKNTETLEESLNKIGSEFYETKYYTTFQDVKQLANFKDTGVNISITNLNVIMPISADLKDRLNEDKCNLDNTKIVIYPKDPYGKKDYSLKVELACEK